LIKAGAVGRLTWSEAPGLLDFRVFDI
jgi:hypothetical protein